MSDANTRVKSRGAFDLLPVGVVVTRKPTFDEWAALGVWLHQMDRAIQWWIGDWLNVGEAEFGEKAAQAMDATDWEFGTLQQYRWVAERVPRERRDPRLSFFHHREVADLSASEQVRWLGRALEGDDDGTAWSVHRLRLELKAATQSRPLWVVIEARDAEDARALVERFEAEGRRVKTR